MAEKQATTAPTKGAPAGGPAKGKGKVPVIVMLDKPAGSIELTVEMMRLAANLRDRGATDFIGKPFPTAGRTLDRVIKKVLGLFSCS